MNAQGERKNVIVPHEMPSWIQAFGINLPRSDLNTSPCTYLIRNAYIGVRRAYSPVKPFEYTCILNSGTCSI